MSAMTAIQATVKDSDISERARSLAREVDRLPAGFNYVLHIVKDEVEAIDWRVEIVRTELIRRMTLSRDKNYHAE